MPQPWVPEHVVDLDLARALVAAQFPDLGPRTIETLGTGFDNTAFLVNGEIVFRFPRRRIAVECIETEATLLPHIAPHVPLAIPVPEWRGRPDASFPWSWAGYRVLPGTTACVADLDGAELARAAAPLGTFLRALHGIELEAPGDTIRRADLERRKPPAREGLAILAERGVLGDVSPWLALLDDEAPGPTEDHRLLHGDLYARHILVDDAHDVSGIIDWGDVHAGDPAIDLAVAFNFLPADARDAFVDAYGPVDEITWRRARIRALLHSVDVARYAHAVGDAALLRASVRSLLYVREG